uniref:Uncharacterized protein n=2 Tax=Guillardia theta TaxID=55529 RepID=A0A7S4NXP8_GUITH|mmetsp:Transcript_36586/g.114220  ORF Transcript_36586/g.114220 Transcript_36586/m.114220 type:complete len:124 (+) Transcript_36586:453-824(+)
MKRKEEKLNQETSQAIKDINQELLDEAAEEELTHGPFVDSFPMMSGNYGTLMQPKTDSATIAASARGSAVTGKTPTAFLNGQPIFSDDPMVPFLERVLLASHALTRIRSEGPCKTSHPRLHQR